MNMGAIAPPVAVKCGRSASPTQVHIMLVEGIFDHLGADSALRDCYPSSVSYN